MGDVLSGEPDSHGGPEGAYVQANKTFGDNKSFIIPMRNEKLGGRQRVRVTHAPASVRKRNDFLESTGRSDGQTRLCGGISPQERLAV